jgi:hypothetical protein
MNREIQVALAFDYDSPFFFELPPNLPQFVIIKMKAEGCNH